MIGRIKRWFASRRAKRAAHRNTQQFVPLPPPTVWLPQDSETASPVGEAHVSGTPGPLLASTPAQAATLSYGAMLGDGGQGKVFELLGQPHYVAKEFITPVPDGATSFVRYQHLRQLFQGLEGIDAAWPVQPITSGELLRGFVMPKIPPQFYLSIAGKELAAQIQYAIPQPDSYFAPTVQPDALERLAIIQRIAVFLDVLHRADHVYGDLSWGNMLYSLKPTSVFVLDVDSIRPLGASTMTGDTGGFTPGWEDPAAPSAGVTSSFDGDRFKFALLLSRMLITSDLSSPLASDLGGASIAGLDAGQNLMVGHLLDRASQRPGGRPTIAEWRVALGVPR